MSLDPESFRILSALALVDGELHREEKLVLLSYAKDRGLPVPEAQKLLKGVAGSTLAIRPPADPVAQRVLFEAMLEMAPADGRLHPKQRELFLRVAPSLGVSPEEAERAVTALAPDLREAPPALGALELLALTSVRVFSAAFRWAFLGLGLGLLAFGVQLLSGALDHPWDPWSQLRWVLLFLYPALAGVLLGAAGAARGVGATLLHVGVERGQVERLVETLLDRLVGIARRSEQLDQAIDDTEIFLRDLPLERWEQGLKRAVHDHLGEAGRQEEAVGLRRRLLRRVRRALCRRIERYLLAIVRAELTASGGGGVCMYKVRALASGRVEDLFAGAVRGGVFQQTLLAAGLLILALLVAPLLLALL